MSVKVVSPTDPGQPELPMSLRPQPSPAGARRSRQCVSPAAESRQRPASAVDSRQPQLPIALCTSGAELPAPEIPEQTRPADIDSGRPVADSRQLELSAAEPSGQPVAPPASGRPAAFEPQPVAPSSAGSGQSVAQPQSVAPSASVQPAALAEASQPELQQPAVAEPGRLELSAAEPAGQPVAPSVAGSGEPATLADAPQAEPRPVVSSAAGSGEFAKPQAQPPVADLPAPGAPAAGAPELPMELRPPGADSDQSQLPMSLRPPASPAAAGLLAQARRGLAEAAQETRPAERFIGAYLAALRGAAAVLAARGRPHRGRARPASTWVLLDSVAPELREWSAFFASNSATRAAAQAGITGKVTAESAAGLVGAATPFLELVRRLVHGLPITGEAHVA
ncbi:MULTISPECIES: SAV_6107 family HEPN domain-containing protein [unclassified Amycolatopsis]|uniref:SAV_6107 family HEPN domain-containing protein n=2 Tax=unclassified Amycolatopsis TaxID=2618356 RepID=UPI0037C19A28